MSNVSAARLSPIRAEGHHTATLRPVRVMACFTSDAHRNESFLIGFELQYMDTSYRWKMLAHFGPSEEEHAITWLKSLSSDVVEAKDREVPHA